MKPWLDRKNRFTPSERKLADYIVKNEERLSFLTERDIGELLDISVATVSRFWRKIGYANFKAYKMELAARMDTAPSPADKMRNLLTQVDEGDPAGKMLTREIGYLQQTLQRLDREQFGRAVETLAKTSRVYVFGAGPSASLSELLRFRLNRFGKAVAVLPRSGAELFEILVHAREGDVFVVFGFFRASPEIRTVLDYARERGCKTVLFTDLTVSEMIDASDIVLYACRGDSRQFHSIAAPVALVDALIVAIAQKNEVDSVERLNGLYDLRKRYSHLLPN